MRIVVLVKTVPDTWGDRKLDLETGLADRAASESVLDEIGERALEVALGFADSHPGTEVVVLSMGDAASVAGLRKGLAMGAGSAVHVADEQLLGADYGLTAEVIAAALRRTGFDLVITGNLSTDGAGGVLPAMLAEWLDVPNLTSLASVEITESRVSGARATETGVATIEAALPAVISITEALPDARFSNFKGIMAAKKKPFEVVSVADLGVEIGDEAVGRSIVLAVTQRPARTAGRKLIDEGTAAEQLADFLVSNRLA